MDMQALGNDLDKALRTLPRPMVEKLFTVVGAFKNDLGGVIPQIMPVLMPHVLAAIPEYGMGILDTEEIGSTMMKVFQNYLGEGTPVTVPDAPVVLKAG